MPDDYAEGVPSTAAIAKHPIHHLLIPFPIAFLVAALVTDLAHLVTADADASWARASAWLVGAGLVMGVLAAATGLIDFLTIARARAHTAGWVHFFGNAVVLILALISLLLRIGDPAGGVLPFGLLLSIASVLLLLVTGWFGGELAYRYKIGVFGRDDDIAAAHQAGRRL